MFALRMAKTLWSFGCSECNRVNLQKEASDFFFFFLGGGGGGGWGGGGLHILKCLSIGTPTPLFFHLSQMETDSY